MKIDATTTRCALALLSITCMGSECDNDPPTCPNGYQWMVQAGCYRPADCTPTGRFACEPYEAPWTPSARYAGGQPIWCRPLTPTPRCPGAAYSTTLDWREVCSRENLIGTPYRNNYEWVRDDQGIVTGCRPLRDAGVMDVRMSDAAEDVQVDRDAFEEPDAFSLPDAFDAFSPPDAPVADASFDTFDASMDRTLDATLDASLDATPPPPDRGEPFDRGEPGDDAPPDLVTPPCGVRRDGVACAPGAPGCDVAELSLGGFNCARFTDGSVRCWGQGIHGDGTAGSCGTPSLVQGLRGATQVAVGAYFACARTAAGAVCWGNNPHGQFGNGASGTQAMAPIDSPLPAGTLGFGVATAGLLTASGQLLTWGYAGSYGLGDGTLANRATPAPLELPPTRLFDLGNGFGCAVATVGAARCWGTNNLGQAGQPSGASVATPREVAELTDVVELSAAVNFSCARQTSGAVLCWGANLSGQLGRGTTNSSQYRPAAVVDLPPATQVAASDNGACALVGGEVWCWGRDLALGTGSTSLSARPVRVTGLTGVRALAGGATTTCAWLGGVDVRCWGQWVGDGTSRTSLTPSRVLW